MAYAVSMSPSLGRTSSTVLEEVFQDVRGLNKNVKATINEKKLGSTKRPCSVPVLTVNHNESDEGNNLTDVRHSTTNVNGAK